MPLKLPTKAQVARKAREKKDRERERDDKRENNQKSNTNLQFGFANSQRELQVDNGNLLKSIEEKLNRLKEQQRKVMEKL